MIRSFASAASLSSLRNGFTTCRIALVTICPFIGVDFKALTHKFVLCIFCYLLKCHDSTHLGTHLSLVKYRSRKIIHKQIPQSVSTYSCLTYTLQCSLTTQQFRNRLVINDHISRAVSESTWTENPVAIVLNNVRVTFIWTQLESTPSLSPSATHFRLIPIRRPPILGQFRFQ